MRTGGCGVQQTLTVEAASVVKQAVALARQRGHAQVTPLHVANTMLAPSNGLLRQACIKSHTHPRQCRALELCFNVALNRLQASSTTTTTATTKLDPHSQHPSISNALIAAFKRAQAHQKRGTIENQQQQQTLLSVKIELDQLIISILDDPSVSRVMREAGFSSIKVKNNLEKSISLQSCSQTPLPINNNPKEKTLFSEDVISVIQSLMNKKKKNIIIVGEHIESIESVVKDVIDKVHKGDVLEALKEVKFINFPLFTFANLQREEVERKIRELKSLIERLLINGVVLYLGDLKWISDYRDGEKRRKFYCSVEHMIMEIGRLIYEFAENGGFRVMGIATFETYMRCKSSSGHHSLESVWGLHPITLAAEGSLGLSLINGSDNQGESKNRKDENAFSQTLLEKGNQEKQLPFCVDCSAKFEAEARNLQMIRCNSDQSTFSSLPLWLRDECRRSNGDEQRCATLKELHEKWISICNTVHKQSKSLERSLTFPSTPSPSSSNSCFSYDQQFHNLHHNHLPSTSSSETMDMEYIPKFKEFNSVNLNTLCDALEKKVPWQKQIIREVVGTILQCRSGMFRRKNNKQETWLFFQGRDSRAKDEIARELARFVYGSYSNFVSISLSKFSSKRVDSSEDFLRNKRSRDEENCSNYIERFSQAVANNPHRVFLIEDVDQVNYSSQKEIKRVIETGKFINFGGEEINLCDAIFILSCDDDSFNFRSPSVKKKIFDGSDDQEACKVSLDLNLYFSNEIIENHVNDEIGFLENVDKRVVFNIVGK